MKKGDILTIVDCQRGEPIQVHQVSAQLPLDFTVSKHWVHFYLYRPTS